MGAPQVLKLMTERGTFSTLFIVELYCDMSCLQNASLVPLSSMRFWPGYIAGTAVLTLLCVTLLWTSASFFQGETKIIAPIPKYVSLSDNKEVRFFNIWKPLIEKIYGDTKDAPVISAHSALMYDLTTKRTLYEKNSHEKVPMASLTKIMTAIVALEHPKSDDRYTVYGENLVGEDSMGVLPGEVFTLKELLYGLMLKSGNDAAEVLASNHSGGREDFLRIMNEKAGSMGLSDTHFSNPSGLQGDGEQYTTAQDLLVITKYALENFPDFAEVAATSEHTLPATATHQEYYLLNETNLLTTYPGVKGVKTGYTPEAGMCLVTFLDYKDHKIIGILLNSENRRQEMKDLLDYSLLSLSITPPPHE